MSDPCSSAGESPTLLSPICPLQSLLRLCGFEKLLQRAREFQGQQGRCLEKFELKEKTRLLGKCAVMQPVRMLLTSSGEEASRLQRALRHSRTGQEKQIQRRQRGRFYVKACRGQFRLLSCRAWSTASLNQTQLGGKNASASAKGFAGARDTGLTADEKVHPNVCNVYWYGRLQPECFVQPGCLAGRVWLRKALSGDGGAGACMTYCSRRLNK